MQGIKESTAASVGSAASAATSGENCSGHCLGEHGSVAPLHQEVLQHQLPPLETSQWPPPSLEFQWWCMQPKYTISDPHCGKHYRQWNQFRDRRAKVSGFGDASCACRHQRCIPHTGCQTRILKD